MLQYDRIVCQQQLLLPLDVDVEIRLSLVQVVKRHSGKGAYLLEQAPVDTAVLQCRMGEDDQDAAGAAAGAHRDPTPSVGALPKSLQIPSQGIQIRSAEDSQFAEHVPVSRNGVSAGDDGDVVGHEAPQPTQLLG